jgi:hypothetical protein
MLLFVLIAKIINILITQLCSKTVFNKLKCSDQIQQMLVKKHLKVFFFTFLKRNIYSFSCENQ